jgi:hypothetical protein
MGAAATRADIPTPVPAAIARERLPDSPPSHPQRLAAAGDPGSGGSPQAGQESRQPDPGSRVHCRRWWSKGSSILGNALLPLLAYALLRPHMGGDTPALAISMALPGLFTLYTYLLRRRLDPLGIVSLVGFCVALLVSFLTDGSSLAFKLQDPLLTGALGLACVGSVAVRRPLQLVVLRSLARHSRRAAATMSAPGAQRTSAIVTAMIGAICLAHATAVAVLALTVSTSMFLSLSRPVGIPIFVGGLGVLLWYRRRRAVWPGPPA